MDSCKGERNPDVGTAERDSEVCRAEQSVQALSPNDAGIRNIPMTQLGYDTLRKPMKSKLHKTFLRVLAFCLGVSKIVIFCENGVVERA